MINDLRYAVTFPTNGISLSGQLSLQPGSTAISGRNGTGKSFIAEMIRYGFFGKKALRGPASDYKALNMAMTFTVGDAEYQVTRGKKEILYGPDGESLAVGADAVSKKIVEILGFDLEVFDVVCAANQKESERLTRLTPAKRKELIDDVVGLTRQEAVEKACKDEANGLRREAEALTRMLVLPVEPVQPTDYRKSEDVLTELRETKELVAKRERLQRIIDAVPEKPAPPAEPVGDITALEAHEKARIENEARRAQLEATIAHIPEPQWTEEQLDEIQAYVDYQAAISRLGPKPSIDCTTFELKEMLDVWDEIEMLKRIGNVDLQCPKCSHTFCPSHELPEEPAYSKSQIRDELQARTRWATAPAEPKNPGRIMSSEAMKSCRLALDRADEKKLMQEELDRLPDLEIKLNQLEAARTRQRLWDIYEHKYEHWREAADAATDAQTELEKLSVPKATVDTLQAIYTSSIVYENQLEAYEAAKARFDELTAEIAEKQERADAFAAGAKGLVEARRTLKAFLAPSLSRVASKIISEMTVNAERPITEIFVDEDMNITADGQDVGTFNGAHATMINLALRLALGQVLVARVFPVFIGDELDSDADAENAQAIADALMTCTDQLKQIVVISHKRLEGFDNEVTL